MWSFIFVCLMLMSSIYFFLSPKYLLAMAFPNVLVPKNLSLWRGQQTKPKLSLSVLLVLAAACKSPFASPVWIPVTLHYHSQTRRPSAFLSFCSISCQHCLSSLWDITNALGVELLWKSLEVQRKSVGAKVRGVLVQTLPRSVVY